MTPRMDRPDRDLFTDLAGLLGRGYLRLAERSRNVAVSDARDQQKELELRREQSPPVDGSDGDNGPPWKAA